MCTGIFQQSFISTFLLAHQMFSLPLGRTCKQFEIVLLYNRKCRNEYYYRSYLQKMSFNSRVVFSEPEILASLAKIGILSFWIYVLYAAALAKSLASPVLQNSDIFVCTLCGCDGSIALCSLQHGADPTKKNRDGNTPLDLVKEGDTDIQDLLRGDAALLDAAKKGCLARVQKLCTQENINCRDTQGRNSTPLHLAGERLTVFHRMIEVERDLWKLSVQTPSAQEGVPRPGCLEPCPSGLWRSPSRETP